MARLEKELVQLLAGHGTAGAEELDAVADVDDDGHGETEQDRKPWKQAVEQQVGSQWRRRDSQGQDPPSIWVEAEVEREENPVGCEGDGAG
uniref:Uncharacterized protein n=1 Tax=Oryza meridionalis TaxID=40149 RepID=A0A0E0D9K5_9ORYZ